MASPNGNPNPNNLNSPFDIWRLFSPPHNGSPPMASPAGNPNLNLNNPNLPFDSGIPFSPPHNQLPPMASPAGDPDLNPNNPNLPFDTGVLFSRTHNPAAAPTAASIYHGAAGQSWLSLSIPDNYPVTTHSFHHGPYLHYTEDPQPPMPHSDITFPMVNPNTNPIWSSNPVGPYPHYVQDLQTPMPRPDIALPMVNPNTDPIWSRNPVGPYPHYAQDLQTPVPCPDIALPMVNPNTDPIWSSNPVGPNPHYAQNLQTHVPRPAISFPMPNPNQRGNTGGPYHVQGLQNPMPNQVTSFPMPNRRANPNRSAASGTTPKHREGALNESQDVIPIDSDSDSEGFFEETPTNSKSNGKASSSSLKTGGKASSFSEEAGKGGKAFSAGKGGKASASNAKPTKSDAELKLELDMPPNSRILMDCEAAEMLQQIHEHMAILSEDPKIKIPECFDKAFQYAKEGNHFTTAKSVKEILQPLKKHGVSDGEICMIANIGPETIEEVYALVPSLKATRSINEGPIKEALAALANIKASK